MYPLPGWGGIRDREIGFFKTKRVAEFDLLKNIKGQAADTAANAFWLRPPHDETGASNRVRTDDLLITNQLLYQLSYAGL